MISSVEFPGPQPRIDSAFDALHRHLRQKITPAPGMSARPRISHIGLPTMPYLVLAPLSIRVFDTLDPDLVDVAAIERYHQRMSVPRSGSSRPFAADARAATGQTRQCREAVGLVDRSTSTSLEAWRISIQPSTVSEPSSPRSIEKLLLVLVGKLARDSFEQVGGRLHALRAPYSSSTVSDRYAGMAQLFHQLQRADALMHHEGLADRALDIDRAINDQVAQDRGRWRRR